MTTEWSGGLVEWIEGNTAYISVVFSWQLSSAYQRAVWLNAQGYEVRAGGPAVDMNPDYLTDVALIGGKIDALPRHNPNATFTSRGCPNKCDFCIVPKIEGALVELDEWPIRPIVCDNNLLACRKKHFDDVVDKLKGLKDVDFNQGLDVRLMNNHHVQRLTELDLSLVRLAWDHINLEKVVMATIERLIAVGIPKRKIRPYVLIGYNDTPEDALYRLQTLKDLGIWPSPMRYQPLDAIRRNNYIGPNWDEPKLKDYMRYWSRLNWLEHIPFEEYVIPKAHWSKQP